MLLHVTHPHQNVCERNIAETLAMVHGTGLLLGFLVAAFFKVPL